MSNFSIKNLPLAQRIYLHGELLNFGILPSCSTCMDAELRHEHLNDGLNSRVEYLHCKKYKAAPPLSVAIVGCEVWEQDIPF